MLTEVNVPRCQHLKINGTRCGSPALRNQKFCYFHQRWHQQRISINLSRKRQARACLDLPLLEDRESVQMALMQVLALVLRGQIDTKTAGLLLYGLQTASTNLQKPRFEPVSKGDVVIDPGALESVDADVTLWDYEDSPPSRHPKPAIQQLSKPVSKQQDEMEEEIEVNAQTADDALAEKTDPNSLPPEAQKLPGDVAELCQMIREELSNNEFYIIVSDMARTNPRHRRQATSHLRQLGRAALQACLPQDTDLNAV